MSCLFSSQPDHDFSLQNSISWLAWLAWLAWLQHGYGIVTVMCKDAPLEALNFVHYVRIR